MIYTDAVIENFRGVRLCKLEGLGQVNLFFGKNNCGKSSLLEALFLLSGQSNPTLPVTINGLRGLNVAGEDDLLSLFYRADKRNTIFLGAGGQRGRNVKISLWEEHDEVFSPGKLNKAGSDYSNKKYGLDFEFTLSAEEGGRNYRSRLSLLQGEKQMRAERDKSYTEQFVAGYISPNALLQDDIDALKEVIRNKHENEIMALLRIVEPRMKDIQAVGEKIMVDIGLPTRLPINLLGDGVRKVLSVILSIYERRDGALMVDEIENGLHYSVMGKLWTAILHSTVRTGTQIFITTHSIDIVKSLVASMKNYDGPDCPVAAYKLVRKGDDELVALRYDIRQLDYAMQQELEVR